MSDLETITRLAVGYAKSTRGAEPDPQDAVWANGLAGYLTDADNRRWAMVVMPDDGDRDVQEGVFADVRRFLDTGETPPNCTPSELPAMAGRGMAIVCGGRSGYAQAFVSRALDAWSARHPLAAVIHGACRDPRDPGTNPPATEAEAIQRDGARDGWSADMCADRWARARGLTVTPILADWHPNGGPLDRTAGPRRNREMLALLCATRDAAPCPVAVLAFAGGTGTEGMVGLAHDAGVPVWRATETGWVRG